MSSFGSDTNVNTISQPIGPDIENDGQKLSHNHRYLLSSAIMVGGGTVMPRSEAKCLTS